MTCAPRSARTSAERRRTRHDEGVSDSEVFTVPQVYRQSVGVETRTSVHLDVDLYKGLTATVRAS